MDNNIFNSYSCNNKYYKNIDNFNKYNYLNHTTKEELQLDSYKHFINKTKQSPIYTNSHRPYFIDNDDMQKPYLKKDNIFRSNINMNNVNEVLSIKETQIYGPLTTNISNKFKKFNNISLQENLNNPANYGPLENEMKMIYINKLVNENNKRQSMKNIIQEDIDALFNF